MCDTQMIRVVEENANFNRMVGWFNCWLDAPLSEREKTIISETISYMKKVEAVDGRY